VGNSSANATHTATQIVVANSTNSATLTPISLTIGTTVVNTTALAGNGISLTSLSASNLGSGTVPDARISGAYTNVTSLALGANVVANVTTLFVGNSSANATHTATQVAVANTTNTATLTPISLTIGTTVANTIGFYAGANVFANTTTVFAGNSSANTVLTATQIAIANTTNSATLTPISLTIGTTVINTTAIAGSGGLITGLNADNLSTGTVPLARLSAANSTANGVVTSLPQTFGGEKTFQNTAFFLNAVSVTQTVNALSDLGVSGTLSALGQLAVTANAAFDTNVLFVDAVNNRVGILNSAPTTALTVTGTVIATTFSGDGAALSSLNASAVSTGSLAYARLANTTAGRILMANASGSIEALAMSGDVTIGSTGVTAIGSGKVTSDMIADGTIVNGDISGSAAIAVSKLASSTISGITLGNNLNAVTFNNGGAGTASGNTYNGSSALTVSYNTIGAAAANQTMYIGTTALQINRANGSLTVDELNINGRASTWGPPTTATAPGFRVPEKSLQTGTEPGTYDVWFKVTLTVMDGAYTGVYTNVWLRGRYS